MGVRTNYDYCVIILIVCVSSVNPPCILRVSQHEIGCKGTVFWGFMQEKNEIFIKKR